MRIVAASIPHMKKPPSLQASLSRMRQRVQQLPLLPPAERGRACYCNGVSKADFCDAVNRGEEAAVNLALDTVAAEVWLDEHDAGRYGRAFRAALRRACLGGMLSAVQKRILLSIEMRNWKRLVLRARHSVPGESQQRASRRLPGQRLVMQRCFGLLPELQVDSEEWPAVEPPVDLLQKAVKRGWLSEDTAAQLAASSYEMLMELLHPPLKRQIFTPDSLPMEDTPDLAAQIPDDALCYYFGCEGRNSVRWTVAPWGELRGLCGLVLAADGSFFLNHDEWGGVHGYGICPPFAEKNKLFQGGITG